MNSEFNKKMNGGPTRVLDHCFGFQDLEVSYLSSSRSQTSTFPSLTSTFPQRLTWETRCLWELVNKNMAGFCRHWKNHSSRNVKEKRGTKNLGFSPDSLVEPALKILVRLWVVVFFVRETREATQWKAPGSPNNPDLPGEEQESETQLPETTWHNAARWEQKSSGKCQIEGACLSSPHFPKPYGPREGCEVSLPPFSVIRIVNFTTESKYDYLTINGYKYSGSGESVVGATGVLWSNISWQSYRGASHGGWRICVEKPPSCSDGLELVPVAIPDCPPSGEDLPNCNDAAPGELCEGDGRCGTRKDINNCYDQFHTYPATRDVYQKANTRTSTAAMTTATRTTRTATTMTKTSTTSTTTPLAFRSAGEQWIVGGPCRVDDRCLRSPRYLAYGRLYGPNQSCVASLPPFSVITIRFFSTRKYFDSLTVNGYKYSGSGLQGTSTVLWSNISWTSSGWNNLKPGMPLLPRMRGWRICVEKPPSCSDGLEVVPVAISDCPPSGEDLPNCNDAAPGELCEGDGRCGTREDLNNCYDKFHTYPATRDVYQKETGSTRTSTTSTTTMTMTVPLESIVIDWSIEIAFWVIAGAFAVAFLLFCIIRLSRDKSSVPSVQEAGSAAPVAWVFPPTPF